MLKAKIAALAPGIPNTSIPLLIAAFTNRVPGSEIDGVPASETKAQTSPDSILSSIS